MMAIDIVDSKGKKVCEIYEKNLSQEEINKIRRLMLNDGRISFLEVTTINGIEKYRLHKGCKMKEKEEED
jgi:hypothetical protein